MNPARIIAARLNHSGSRVEKVPVIDETSGAVVGTIDVESERKNAFSAEDQAMLEEGARTARPLLSQQ